MYYVILRGERLVNGLYSILRTCLRYEWLISLSVVHRTIDLLSILFFTYLQACTLRPLFGAMEAIGSEKCPHNGTFDECLACNRMCDHGYIQKVCPDCSNDEERASLKRWTRDQRRRSRKRKALTFDPLDESEARQEKRQAETPGVGATSGWEDTPLRPFVTAGRATDGKAWRTETKAQSKWATPAEQKEAREMKLAWNVKAGSSEAGAPRRVVTGWENHIEPTAEEQAE